MNFNMIGDCNKSVMPAEQIDLYLITMNRYNNNKSLREKVILIQPKRFAQNTGKLIIQIQETFGIDKWKQARW